MLYSFRDTRGCVSRDLRGVTNKVSATPMLVMKIFIASCWKPLSCATLRLTWTLCYVFFIDWRVSRTSFLKIYNYNFKSMLRFRNRFWPLKSLLFNNSSPSKSTIRFLRANSKSVNFVSFRNAFPSGFRFKRVVSSRDCKILYTIFI